ncbi:hypothetical protein GCM10007320_65760 [Pseudorhodoferax aquiterrae]|uniref:Uncharacterized protein n=2 Tax=Pseudorhodoferax aquiterrae TaxID=747304 RepID=A0ABQ3GHN8_9BURK|nr:hypothetical protein GCM10007320_65760 [Pseudorhodoferax aquiterrae]
MAGENDPMNKSQMIQTGWLVETAAGLMYWPMSELAEAFKYCEADAKPVPAWAYASELDAHQSAQATQEA